MTTKRAFITGVSQGLGYGLAHQLLAGGWQVFALGRRPYPHSSGNLNFISCDLRKLPEIQDCLQDLLSGQPAMDLAILNAGVLGQIRDLSEVELTEIKSIMDVNLWSNKLILDWFLAHGHPRQIVGISSGASVSGNRGWGAYGISKAALNMLISLYAHEFPDSHLSSLAPGLIESGMQEFISKLKDTEKYPTLRRLQAARGTEAMPDPVLAGRLLLSKLDAIREKPTGVFLDIRRHL